MKLLSAPTLTVAAVFLRKESETALRVLYALKQFKRFLTNQEQVELLNTNVTFWIQYEASFTSTLLIRIRRLYESKNSTFNFQKFIKYCLENVSDFSISALKSRKISGSDNAEEWIDEYMAGIYGAQPDDFKELSKTVRENSKKMKGKYSNAASTIYAHAVHMDVETIQSITSELDLDEIETALLSIWHCYEQIWQMYENGRVPTFDVGRYQHEQEVYDSVTKQLYCKPSDGN